MPYKKYAKKKRSYGRKKRYSPWYNRTSVGDVARAAYSGVQYIKGLINVEKHRLDTTFASTVNSTGSVTLLSGIGQGDDVNNRQGNSVLGKNLYLRYHTYRDPVNAATTNTLRMIIVKDLENTGSAPTIANMLAAVDVDSPLNVDTLPRWEILRDKVFTLGLQGNMGFAGKQFIKINDHLKFTGSATTDVYKNAIYLILLSSESTGPPTMDLYARLEFYDN